MTYHEENNMPESADRLGSVAAGDYDIVWRSPSADSGGSMPCGGHSVGLAVWVEDGGIRFYVDRSGSFDENNLMLKLGRVVVALDPNPFGPDGGEFVQRLDLHAGRVLISGRGADGRAATVTVWCETDSPVVHVDVDADGPVAARVTYQSWRAVDRVVPEEQRLSCFSVLGQPDDMITRADEIGWCDEGVIFFHRNRSERNSFVQTATLEGLAHRLDDLWNPQQDRIFGGVLGGPGFVARGEGEGEYAGVPHREWALAAEPAVRHRVTLALHDDRTADIGDFTAAARDAARRALRDPDAADRTARVFWASFWARSAVEIWPEAVRSSDPDWQVGRNYALFRYLLGCNARGEHPTKFNGGLFTTDACFSVPGHPYGATTPDFRVWGGGSITGQNQRLVHWPMLRAGDADLLRPQFEFYRRALGNAVIRTRELWGHAGCSFCEQVDDSGLPVSYEWGWDGPRDHAPGDHYRREAFFDATELARPWVRYHYSTQLEMAYLVVQAHLFGGLDVTPYMPFVDAAITFYDEHYRMRHRATTGRELTTGGELVIFPSTAVETYKDATNPTDAVLGLRHVLGALIGPARDLVDDETAERYRRILDTVPHQSFREVDGVRVLAPAQSWSDIMNVELPQLYGVFPYPDYGVGRPDLQIARDTYAAPEEAPGQRDHISWHQDGIFAARLGLTDEAQRVARLKLADGPLRFPAFWGPGHDWTPDHNWGGSGMVGVQEMLLQEVDEAIHVLPAWPDGVDVDFRLHARGGTVVSVSYRDGSIARWDVAPAERAADCVMHKPVAG